MTRLETTFLALVMAQAAHSVEEYFGRLWEVFPPARFVTGLVSEDRRLGFIVINVALFAFGIWSSVWPVHRQWPSARAVIGVWILIELINGVGHPLWSVAEKGYTPGVITAPLLLALALLLMWQLKKTPGKGRTSHRCQFGRRSRLVRAHEARPPASWQASNVGPR